MNLQPINLKDKFALITQHWTPRVVAELNDYQFKLAKIKGEFVWHEHANTDEAFIVISGQLTIEFSDGEVLLNEGEMFVVPKGTQHRPVAAQECQIMIIEPCGVRNTGEIQSDLTAPTDNWI